jgi:steroid delta-isomerase-like uncharacterized protein
LSEESLAVVAAYVAAMAAADDAGMAMLRSEDFVLDFVHGDAFADDPLAAHETSDFWPAWFRAFPEEFDYEVTRTVAAAPVVVTEWVFSGANSGAIGEPIFTESRPPTGRTIRFRGVSVYDIAGGKIARETMYMDLTTLMVELGIEP